MLPKLCQAQATQYDTPSPDLSRKLRHSFRAWCIILCWLSLAELRQRKMIHQAGNYHASCVIGLGLVNHTVQQELTQHSMIHRTLKYGATCVIMSGLVCHNVLPKLGLGFRIWGLGRKWTLTHKTKAAQYDTPSPKLWCKLRHSCGPGVSYCAA